MDYRGGKAGRGEPVVGAQVRGDGDRGDVLEMMLVRLADGLPVGVGEGSVQLQCEGQ